MWIGSTIVTETTRDIEDRMVSLARDLILIPSCASRPEEIERCLNFVSIQVETLHNVDIRQHTCEGIPSLVVLPRGCEVPEILFLGHLDVIEHDDLSSYRSTVSDGRIVGPGAGDMKGALAVLLNLFIDLHHRHDSLSLGMALTTDEERGGMCGARYLLDDVGLTCGEAILADGGTIDEIAVEEKGVLHLEVTAAGISAHAAYPWLGVNPVDHLLDGLTALRRRFEDFREDVGEEDHWFPTCAVTAVHTESQTTNRIPAAAAALVDVRFTPPWTVDAMLDEVRKALGPQLELRIIIGDEPSHLSPTDGFLTITEEILGYPPRLIRASGGSDARFLCKRGIPVIVSRPVVGDLHAPTEWIDIESMKTYHAIVERFVESRLTVPQRALG